MLRDLTNLDLLAFGVFVAVWFGYAIVLHGWVRPANSINARMVAVRERWMIRFLERDNRMMDAQLNGVSIRTASFFASTTILVIGALAGVLGVAEQIFAKVANLAVFSTAGPQSLFELKIFLLIAIMIYAFFKFTWAIRQFSYFAAVMGSAPYFQPGNADPILAKRMALIRTQAVGQLNGGLRAYYFAMALLGWFVGPLVFMITTVVMASTLIYRQLYSPSAGAIHEYSENLS
jgi:uncharacterized membrane protein